MYIVCFTCVQGSEARSTDTSTGAWRYPLCRVSNLTRPFPREQLKCRLHDEAEPWWKLDVCLYEPKVRVHCISGNGNTSCFDRSSRFIVCCFLLFCRAKTLATIPCVEFGTFTLLVFVFTGSGSKNSTEEQGTKPYPHFPEHVQITWWFSFHVDVANHKTLISAIGDHPLSGDGIFPKQVIPSDVVL